MNQQETVQKIKDAFAANPGVQMFHVTCDGLCFIDEHAAAQHAVAVGTTADEKKAIPVTRDMLAEAEEEMQQNQPAAIKPLRKLNLNELREKCKELDIEFTEEFTRAQLIQLIETHNANI